MNNKDEILPKVEQVKTSQEELEYLAKFSGSTEFAILKRVARRYAENLKNLSFTLPEEDPYFAIKHTRYVEQAVGMNLLIKIVTDARKQLDKFEEADNGQSA